MIFFIIFGIIVLIAAVAVTMSLTGDFADFLGIIVLGGVLTFGLLFAISFIWQSEKTSIEIKEILVSVDTETLNGREFYLVKSENHSFTYATQHDKGVISPQVTWGEDVTLVEDEEENPYVVIKAYSVTSPDVSWLIPWVRPSKEKQIDISDEVTREFHIPAKSTRYYLPAENN